MDTYEDDYQPMYERDPMEGHEPDPEDWMIQQAEAEWAAMPWWQRQWETTRSRIQDWKMRWRTRQKHARLHREQHPGIPKSQCPDPFHGDTPPF